MNNLDEKTQEAVAWYDVFKTMIGEDWAPYATPAVEQSNLTKMYVFGKENFPHGLADFRNFGSYEVAFRACLPQLERDPSWKSAEELRKEFADEFALIPAAEARRRYDNEPTFKKKVDAMYPTVRQQGE